MDSTTLVTITLERLRERLPPDSLTVVRAELEELGARLPQLLEAAVTSALEQKKRERLTKLVGDPTEHARRQLEKYHKNRDVINARRRAAYKAKKEVTHSIAAF